MLPVLAQVYISADIFGTSSLVTASRVSNLYLLYFCLAMWSSFPPLNTILVTHNRKGCFTKKHLRVY